jgi:uncharacterized protein YjbI with pentapeptide repeats
MKRFLGICVAAFLVVYVSRAVAKTGAGGLNPAEEWVVARVRAGEIADLSKQFPDKEKDKRNLTAHFLEELLMGALPGVKPHRNGVRIVGAIIDEQIDLTNAQIPCEVWLKHCQFNKNATFNSANFAGNVSFENSAFKADARFSGMKVRGDAFFIGAVFEGPVDFLKADIASTFAANEAKFQNKKKGASFSDMKVGGDAFFNDAVFEGPVSFFLADIAGSFLMGKAKFQSKEKDASFSDMKVGGNAFFKDAVFEGPVNFSGAEIASSFTTDYAQFQNKEKDASFNSMKVRGNAFFNFAVFEGPVNFSGADIAGSFGAAFAKFQNKEKGASFIAMKGGYAFFTGAVFEGPANFSGADIAGSFTADAAQFQNKEKDASFNSMKVRGYADFIGAVFEGPVNFIGADIAGNFGANLAKFQNKEKGISFGMKVRGYAFFIGAVFEGPVDFGYSDFAWLNLSSVSWPKVAARFHMRGMSYKYIRAVQENEPQSHKALLKLADQSGYSADVYGNLEKFFLSQGYRGDADRAFIAGKRRERKEYLRGLPWLGSWLLDGLVGYGRRPWKAGIPCVFFVALGCVLFSPKKMEPQKPEDTPRVYNRFWYSLDLFLPVLDLQADDVWKPKTNERFLRHYVRLHVMLGWILIPLVLAALTGLIK